MRCGPMRFLPLLAALYLPAVSSIYGQTLGTVTGEVKDTTGAVIPGVEVTVRNIETNVTRTVATNEEGVYAVPALNPGMYEVKASKGGFKSSVRGNVELQVQQTARVDFGLDVGQVSESVHITGAAPLLTTENATVGTVIEQQRITDLPLNGRNFLSLVALSPNVTYGFNQAAQAAGRQGGTRAGVTMSLSGSRSAWSNYTLDGITNTDINFNLYIVLPSVEALQEFKVQTGIYPAEFGRAAGQVNVSTRGALTSITAPPSSSCETISWMPGRTFLRSRRHPRRSRRRSNRTARTSMGSHWPGQCKSRRFSTGGTACSSCRTSRASGRAVR